MKKSNRPSAAFLQTDTHVEVAVREGDTAAPTSCGFPVFCLVLDLIRVASYRIRYLFILVADEFLSRKNDPGKMKG